MPANANRRRDLYDHLARSGRYSGADYYLPHRDHALTAHPDWPLCTAGCRWPVDPTAGTLHPGCEPHHG